MWIAQLLQLPHPVYALITAIIVTDLDATRTRHLGGVRIVATIIGSGVGMLYGMVLGRGMPAMMLAVATAMLLTELMRSGETAKVAGFVACLVLLVDDGMSFAYAFYRSVETIVGICVAWLLALVPPLFGRSAKPNEQAKPTPLR